MLRASETASPAQKVEQTSLPAFVGLLETYSSKARMQTAQLVCQVTKTVNPAFKTSWCFIYRPHALLSSPRGLTRQRVAMQEKRLPRHQSLQVHTGYIAQVAGPGGLETHRWENLLLTHHLLNHAMYCIHIDTGYNERYRSVVSRI